MSNYKRLLTEVNADKPTPTEETLERINAKIEANKATQLLASRQASLNAKKQRRASKANMTVAQWEVQAQKYYSIDPVTFTVTSIARTADITKAETWQCADKIEAELKVIELIDYKWTDHFERADRPLSDFRWT